MTNTSITQLDKEHMIIKYAKSISTSLNMDVLSVLNKFFNIINNNHFTFIYNMYDFIHRILMILLEFTDNKKIDWFMLSDKRVMLGMSCSLEEIKTCILNLIKMETMNEVMR